MPFPGLLTFPGPSLFPGAESGVIDWDVMTDRYFQHGLDRGVLYPDGENPVPWNGLTGLTESGNGSSTLYYIDGHIYLADVDPTDFSASLTAFLYPDAFARCIGMPQVAEGLFMDNQKPKRFGLSYRNLVGSGVEGDLFGYQIHLIYKAMASIGTKQRKTLTNDPDILQMSFDIVATPVKVSGFRPTAHFVIDTRYLTPETVTNLETILYGVGGVPGQLPEPQDLFDMLNFGEGIDVIHYEDDGLINFTGKASNIVMTGPYTYQINNVNAVDNGDGTYDISDGDGTTVIVV